MSATPPAPARRLRVVAVLPAPLDVASGDVEATWRALQSALAPVVLAGLVEVERLLEASETGLRSRLGQGPCHVVHVIGQGRSRPGAQYATLTLEGAGRRPRTVNVEYLGDLLRAHASLRLVVLQVRDEGADRFAGAPAILVKRGVAAAVALPPVLDEHRTLPVLRALYEALATGSPLGDVLARAQSAGVEVDAAVRADGAAPVAVRDGAAGDEAPTPVSAAATGREMAPPSLPAGETSAHTPAARQTPSPEVAELARKRAAGAFDVFLCHNTADKPAVKAIARRLQELGILPWLDEWELPPGQPWQPLLEQQIDSIRSAAVFVGAAGVGPWQQQELYGFLSEFVRRRSPVIPVVLPDAPDTPALPIFLRAMTWVDFRVSDPDPLERLIWGITGQRRPTG